LQFSSQSRISQEIHDSHHQFSNQFFRPNQVGDLSAGLLDTNLNAKIDCQYLGWLASFSKNTGFDDPSNADFDFQEVVENDSRYCLGDHELDFCTKVAC
jgi:hypothetical protein